jgi:hypothetical protein
MMVGEWLVGGALSAEVGELFGFGFGGNGVVEDCEEEPEVPGHEGRVYGCVQELSSRLML